MLFYDILFSNPIIPLILGLIACGYGFYDLIILKGNIWNDCFAGGLFLFCASILSKVMSYAKSNDETESADKTTAIDKNHKSIFNGAKPCDSSWTDDGVEINGTAKIDTSNEEGSANESLGHNVESGFGRANARARSMSLFQLILGIICFAFTSWVIYIINTNVEYTYLRRQIGYLIAPGVIIACILVVYGITGIIFGANKKNAIERLDEWVTNFTSNPFGLVLCMIVVCAALLLVFSVLIIYVL
jgi:succinate dehydrogenase hydrophobic anchor subunit